MAASLSCAVSWHGGRVKVPYFEHDGLQFHYQEAGQGQGTPFILQHGLGGDVNQPLGLFTPPPGLKLCAFDCRAHGETRPIGDPAQISFVTFVDDLCTFMDHLRIERCVVGGISMGAGLALAFALRCQARVSGLIISRPAWLDRPAPPNLAIYDQVCGLIGRFGAAQGLERFIQTESYRAIAQESPDAAQSLVGQFQHPRAEEALVRLEQIPHDAPITSLKDLQKIGVPTLVLATRQDPIHPYDYALKLARAIPCAVLHEITPKSVSKTQHANDFQQAVSVFLRSAYLRADMRL